MASPMLGHLYTQRLMKILLLAAVQQRKHTHVHTQNRMIRKHM